MLDHLPGETQLDVWRPTASSDLGLQVVDWWAYIADILVFYNERIANEDYLGTAELDSSVKRLVGLLGYRPRPGIGAVATLATDASKPTALVIPAGLPISSKATPGVDSQVFEVTARTVFEQPTSVRGPSLDDLAAVHTPGGPPPGSPLGTADVPAKALLIARGGVLVKGTPTSIGVGDELLLAKKTLPVGMPKESAALVTVTGLTPEKDAHGRTNTRVSLTGTDDIPATSPSSVYRLAHSTRLAHLATLPLGVTTIDGNGSNQSAVLDGVARYVVPGDPLVLAIAAQSPVPVKVTAYSEVLWFANAPDATQPTVANKTPPDPSHVPIPVILAKLGIEHLAGSQIDTGAQAAEIRAGWTDVGELLDTPVDTMAGVPATLVLAAPPAAAAGVATRALLQDRNGAGHLVTVTPQTSSGTVAVAGDPTDGQFQAPLRLFWDLIEVTRGATVRGEVLGTGKAIIACQDFTLAKSPVTFLSDGRGRSGDDYSSTIQLAVGDRYWTEVPMLYGHGPTELVFTTFNDDDGKTHIRTGDGVTGARLPSGARVIANYRTGSGATVPAAGSLTQIATAVPNLVSVRNPVAPWGGGDPDAASALRELAPRSVLTFNRAVSGDDYSAVAAAAPGVRRASAVWGWDPQEQRPIVNVYVGDDAGAVKSATAALLAQSDPNRPLRVTEAIRCTAQLSASVRVDPGFVADDIVGDATAAILALFEPGVLALGESLYRSRLEEGVCELDGVLALHTVTFTWDGAGSHSTSDGHRFWPGAGGYFSLVAADLHLNTEENPDE